MLFSTRKFALLESHQMQQNSMVNSHLFLYFCYPVLSISQLNWSLRVFVFPKTPVDDDTVWNQFLHTNVHKITLKPADMPLGLMSIGRAKEKDSQMDRQWGEIEIGDGNRD